MNDVRTLDEPTGDDRAEEADVGAGEPPVDHDEPVSSRRRRNVLPAAVLVVAALAAVAGVGAWGLAQRERADDAVATLARTQDAALVAGSFVDALLTYDFEDLDAQAAAIERSATSRFVAEFRTAFSDQLIDAITAEQTTSDAEVRDVFTTSDSADTMRAIVAVDSTVRSTTGASVVLESVLELRLVHLDGEWLVDEVASRGSRDVTPEESNR